MLKVLLLCGGQGNERDISINSVRSVYDHLKGLGTVIPTVIFFDIDDRKYLINEKYLYSNTSDDFRFWLQSSAIAMDENKYNEYLSGCDFVFPVIHGIGCEDGEIQKLLEKLNINYIGSPSKACNKMYNKHNADKQILRERNMYNIPKVYVQSGTEALDSCICDFVSSVGEVCIKPVEGGSSFGVCFAKTANEAVDISKNLLKEYKEIVIEKKCAGKEFTIIILDNDGTPVALMPTEIEIKNGDSFFDRRRKYMSTTEVRYHCPARFDDSIINNIRSEAEALFEFVGARDFLRIDGWVLDNGEIYFSDFNPISGMEQNSFIFQQAANIGLTHGMLLEYILKNACKRYGISYPGKSTDTSVKRSVNILLGGITSERQVSLLSGVNVWMKLLQSEKYAPVPYILTKNSETDRWEVCEVPYSFALLHTTEEIIEQINSRTNNNTLVNNVRKRLGLKDIEFNNEVQWIPLEEFVKNSKIQGAYIFLALHGGFGENGGIQAILDEAGVDYNGSPANASVLCMDKYETGVKVTELNIEHLSTCKKILGGLDSSWNDLTESLGEPIIAKPNMDGCSTGVVKICKEEQLLEYINFCREGGVIPANTFENQLTSIAMPAVCKEILFEEYIKTDPVLMKNGKLVYNNNTGWIEMTIGVLEKHGNYHAFNPSVTIAENDILSVEEKFQGGVGINLTPPPENIIPAGLKDEIKCVAEQVAKKCGIEDYCRIDIFANNKTGKIVVIEINTLPGLSPSTVLFQQAAKEEHPFSPLELLEYIIGNGEEQV